MSPYRNPEPPARAMCPKTLADHQIAALRYWIGPSPTLPQLAGGRCSLQSLLSSPTWISIRSARAGTVSVTTARARSMSWPHSPVRASSSPSQRSTSPPAPYLWKSTKSTREPLTRRNSLR
ncbi:hypothetical protein ACFQU9_13090 [Actinomadura namibiensis]|uniref:hypothetical protein n=1 Tax=Actinomadura kijaniata TaxID=46161 RepID=UPI003618DFB2